MNEIFKEILGTNDWSKIQQIEKGWSNEKKYYIETNKGSRLLLRLSDISLFERKEIEFKLIKKLDEIDITISRPIDFGICDNRKKVYTLLTWVDGEDAEEILPTLTNKEQYNLGFEAGKILRKIHEIPSPENQISWGERFNKKIDRNITAYQECNIKYKNSDKIINYINANRHLLKNRPQSFQHGDYHAGNMIVTKEGKLGVIDFNRLDFGDPWEEFNRITWCADISYLFASGRINGYFKDNVPDDFFRLLALYIGSNQLSSIPWAIPFGQSEVNIMLEQARNVLEWYNDFQTYIPKWYVSKYSN